MFWYTTSGITTNHLDRKSVCQRKVAHVQTSNTLSLACSSVIPLSTKNYKLFYDQNAYPESVFCTCVCEVYHQLKWFVVERFQSQQHMVDQEIPINLSHPTM